ncbi:J domain-containing protein [Desulfatitalea tepidiphila]|uniref:J domain-containing protein n=1 Tax=Desulfatitalea tepidiphila TaxID=1185843 RepID=UPI0006B511FB|nr:J domain-containing protein [Desulfatitalea tepidiphila]
MKDFEAQNYYQILKIPMDADLITIKRAYRETLNIYGEEALATYSLFPEEQRTQLLQIIETAFHTLIDTQRRTVYDQMLRDSGKVHEVHEPMQWIQTIETCSDSTVTCKPQDLRSRVKEKYSDEKIRSMADQIIAKDQLSGLELKCLREALDVEISEIFEEMRIPKSTLNHIEADEYASLPAEVFLKSFLKSYAQILQVDSQRVIEGYFRRMALSDR